MYKAKLEPCLELNLSSQELETVTQKAKDWAIMNGISMRSKEFFNLDQVQIAPFLLLPSTFPKKEFEKAAEIQIIINELMHNVAHDHQFLIEVLKSTIEVDDFTRKLFEIYEIVHAEGFKQTISLGLFRSDYMLHSDGDNKIQQVEINTVASSFAGMANAITEFHRYILKDLGHSDKLKNIPDNNSVTGFCTGLVCAWSLYGNEEAKILFVVEDVTYNISDQRFIEFGVQRLNPKIKIIRRNLTELVKQAKLGPQNELIVEDAIISVVYFRSGYGLEAYPTEKEWDVRLLMERSLAIKCPSIQYHLVGTKKVQQVLSLPGVVERFLTDSTSVTKVTDTFTGLYSLDFDENGEKAVAKGISEPRKYVLKPQREGGGNNFYDDNVREQLEKFKDSKERSGWILMDRIFPPLLKNYIIRAGNEENKPQDVICELGIYGVIIGNKNEIKINEQVGHLLRTKLSSSNEGGIVAGAGAIDSPYLVI
ncbi:glutathione synthetase-like [Leptopilina boulardi]|uniref:glutathione synthetase-like n=1 Tax=Leptopilina boulardi TaxID=63433 RepID=UPI0021F5455D|nr:glutathione synthetase-like [Leptopilina boulardi]